MTSLDPDYHNGVPVFHPSYDKFRDFRSFVNEIEPIGMTTGIVKIVPPKEWLDQLPKLPVAEIDRLEIKNPIVQNVTVGSGRGVFGIDNVEKRKKFRVKEWTRLCNNLSNQAPAKRGEKQRPLGSFEAPPGGYVTYDDSDFTPDRLSFLAERFWKGMAYGGAPMYGADLPGSLFDQSTREWNVARLDSLLSALDEVIPGVNDAYLYCGMWKASFAWHVEDMDLPSINYIHFGAPKQWYTIPQSHHQQFYDLMAALWPEDRNKCTEFLRHKTFLADPSFIEKQGIPVNSIVHRQQEFIITFPYGYHAGFNYGFNIAESVNFAHDSWLRIGGKAKVCSCVSHSVGIDVQNLIERIKSSNNLDENLLVKSEAPPPRRQRRLGRCVLCPHIYTSTYVSNPAGTAEVHVNCANLVPETFVVEDQVFGLTDIPKERFALRCSHCKLTLGSCFQCSVPKCTRAFHGSCAAAAGVDYRDVSRPLCRFHRSPEDSTLDPAAVLPGDVVQFARASGGISAGIVQQVPDGATGETKLLKLPNPSGTEVVRTADLRLLFPETPQGPFVEPLLPLQTKRKRKAKDDATSGKQVKTDPKAEASLPTPPSAECADTPKQS